MFGFILAVKWALDIFMSMNLCIHLKREKVIQIRYLILGHRDIRL